MNKIIGKITGSKLISGSIFIFIGTMISNIAAYVYHLATGRILGPTVYGELASLISLLYLFGVVANVLQTALIKYYAEFKANGDDLSAKWLVRESIIKIGFILILIGLVVSIFSPFISNYLNLNNSYYVILSYLAFAVTTLALIFGSFLQGYQMFVWTSLIMALTTVLRLVFSIPAANYGLEWVLWAWLASGLMMIILIFPVYYRKFPGSPKKGSITMSTIIKFSTPTFFAFLGMTSIFTTDIVLVKHFFLPEIAGQYSALAVLGKIIFYATSSLGIVLLPSVSERVKKKYDVSKIIIYSLLSVLAVGALSMFAYFLFPKEIVFMLFGNRYGDIYKYMGLFSVFISLYSLGYITVMSLIAAGMTKIFLVPGISAILQIFMIYIWHKNIMDIIMVNILISLLFFGASFIFVYKSKLLSKI